jgi:hypothetical protein
MCSTCWPQHWDDFDRRMTVCEGPRLIGSASLSLFILVEMTAYTRWISRFVCIHLETQGCCLGRLHATSDAECVIGRVWRLCFLGCWLGLSENSEGICMCRWQRSWLSFPSFQSPTSSPPPRISLVVETSKLRGHGYALLSHGRFVGLVSFSATLFQQKSTPSSMKSGYISAL